MLKKKLAFLSSFLVLPTVSGILEQLNASHPICPEDTVVFRCSNYAGGYVNWDFRATLRRSYAVSFSHLFSAAGTVQNGSLGTVPLSASVDFSNESAMVSSIRMADTYSLNQTNITCNGDKLTLRVGLFDHLLPSKLEVKQFAQSNDFILMWDPHFNANFNTNSNTYIVEIDSFFGHQIITTSSIGLYMKLDNGSNYNITFSANFCGGMVAQKTFIIGICPFLVFDTFVNVQYDIWSTGNVIVTVICPEGNEYTFSCGNNANWPTEINQACDNTDMNHCNNVTLSKEDINIGTENKPSIVTAISQSQHCMPVIAAFTSGFIGATAIFVCTIMFMLGVMKYRSRKIKDIVSTVNEAYMRPDPTSKQSLYEEIKTANGSSGFTVSENAAYGEIKDTM